MKIVVNDIAASEGGALSILKDFYEEVKEYGQMHEWVFLLGDQYLEETQNIKVYTYPKVKKSWFERLFFDFFSGRKIINKFKPDIYFSLQNTATLKVNCRQIVYLHQPLPYQNEKKYSFFKKDERIFFIYQRIIGTIFTILFKMTKAEIVVQSEWLREILSGKMDNSIEIIKPQINIPENLIDTKAYNEKTTNFFYPASLVSYKNHNTIYDAVDLLRGNGIRNFKIYLTLEYQNIQYPENYSFMGAISREEVFRLYNQTVLLFPSIVETYGLPLKEAQYSNSLILASNTDFAKEVLSDYKNKFFFEKNNSVELFELMKTQIENGLPYNFKNKPIEVEKHLLIQYILKEEEA